MRTSTDYETKIQQSLRMTNEAKVALLKSKLESIETLAETYIAHGNYHSQCLIAIMDMAQCVLRETR